MRPLTLFWLLLAASAIATSFWISHEVRIREKELYRARAETIRLRDEIHVLEAEWAWMNRASQVADRARRLLEFAPIPPDRIAELDDLPRPGERPIPAPEAAPSKKSPTKAAPRHTAPGPVAEREQRRGTTTEAALVRPAGGRR